MPRFNRTAKKETGKWCRRKKCKLFSVGVTSISTCQRYKCNSLRTLYRSFI